VGSFFDVDFFWVAIGVADRGSALRSFRKTMSCFVYHAKRFLQECSIPAGAARTGAAYMLRPFGRAVCRVDKRAPRSMIHEEQVMLYLSCQ
jgi:hypothetical protein